MSWILFWNFVLVCVTATQAELKIKLGDTVNYAQFEGYRGGKQQVTLIDVREPDELEEFGSIPSTINIPLGEVDQAFSLGPEAFQETYGIAKPKQDDPIIVFCKSGRRAQTGQDYIANKHQYTNTAIYPGSFTEWNKLNSREL